MTLIAVFTVFSYIFTMKYNVLFGLFKFGLGLCHDLKVLTLA